MGMKLSKQEKEAVLWLREWVANGMEKRVDGSFPTDFLTAFRRIADVPDSLRGRAYEEALIAGPDFDYKLGREIYGYRHQTRRALGLE